MSTIVVQFNGPVALTAEARSSGSLGSGITIVESPDLLRDSRP